jgi:periplasmic protein TonB
VSSLGDLSQCIVYGDPDQVGSARRLRSRALAASMFFETGVVACLLLCPLIRTAVLPPRHMSAPVPVFRRAVPSNPPPVHQPDRPAPRQPGILSVPPLSQPSRVPQRTDTNGELEPPALSDLPISIERDRFSADGDGTEVTNARPGARTRPVVPLLVSRGVMAALLIHRVQPDYPIAARMMHLTGTVQLRAVIGIDGSVRNLEVVSGNPILARAAIDAVRQWRYRPTRLSGEPVEVETAITVQFQMQ